PHPQRRQARRSAGRGADQIRAGHQSRNRQGAWPAISADHPGARRRGDRMRRREFITLLGGAAAPSLLWPLTARAQQRDGVPRIGILMAYAATDSLQQGRVRAFRDALAKLGWSAGINIQFDEHWTTDDMDQVRSHAANLVDSKPDLILSTGGRVIPVLLQL